MTDTLLNNTSGMIPTFFGGSISGTISNTAHTWVADANGLFHTTTNLQAEWQSYYNTMLAGHADTLSFVQRLEGNAEAVFENTGLNKLSAADQTRDREDAQREYDAIGAAMNQLGLDPKAALTTANYLAIEQTIESNASLEELAMQGHGLNNPSLPKYNGYTNDFQNNVDQTTLYIGGGADNNERAIADFFDDAGLSHLPFPTVAQDGHLEQLNQNGDAEDLLAVSVAEIDQVGASQVLTAADFSQTPGNASSTLTPAPATPTPPATPGTITTLWGATISATMTVNGHVWTADANGLFQTTTNLAAEWQGYYQTMLAGNGASLNAIQRLEGNAEAVFENTGLNNLSASVQQRDREDAQREFDAIEATLVSSGIGLNTPLTVATYLQLEHALQDSPAMEELAIQGHGLNDPTSTRYDGYTNDFQNNVDQHTLFVGAGQDTGERAIADLFDDFIMSHVPFPTIAQNGEITQLNQNGDAESTAAAAVEGMNNIWFNTVLKPTDFNVPGNTVPGTTTPPAAGTIITLTGATISNTISNTAHVWVAGSDGLFHTTTNLAAEWQADYQMLLAGNGANMTMLQRMEGNAEAVFENTALANLKPATQERDREDAQREFDAIYATMQQLGLTNTLLNDQTYLEVEDTLRANASLEELAVQGHGLNTPPSARYDGYTNDFQNNVDGVTRYVGGGADNGENALTDFFDDVVMSHLPFTSVYINGTLTQLNQNGDNEDPIDVCVAASNEFMFTRVFVAADFSANASKVGPEVFVSPAMQNALPPPLPTPGAGQMMGLYDVPVPTTIVANGHTWVADSAGRYETTTDLNLEWWNSYQAAQAGQTLTLTQHLEANAEAVFLNTNLANISDGMGQTDREDVQRVIDAEVTVLNQLGLGSGPLTLSQYLKVEQTLQGNAALEELAVQGIGLNNPYVAGKTEYNGITDDFEYNYDPHTLYVGPGQDTGERAIADYLVEDVVGFLPFAVVAQNGELKQLNQNGNTEQTAEEALAGLNQAMFGKIDTAASFSKPGQMPPTPPPAGETTVTTLQGDTIPGTIVVNGDTWVADANGQYQLSSGIGLDMQWRTYYQEMLAGQGNTLTAIQRLEGNAEAFFENTAINNQWMGAAAGYADRMDVQREIDVIAQAMQIDQQQYGIDPTAPLTVASYLQLEHTIQSSPVLEELAIQGYGVVSPGNVQDKGAWNDFISGADWSTDWVGGGLDNGTAALPYYFRDAVISDLAFASVFQNGQWMQLDNNGNVIGSVQSIAAALNNTLYRQVYVAGDFSTSATATGPTVLIKNAPAAGAAAINYSAAPAGDIVTLSGALISNTITVNNHTWTAGADGLFHTTTNLQTEWQGYYHQMLSGFGGTLTALQRMEGNAEAVFEAAGLTSLSAAQQKIDREDVQRQIDALAGAVAIDASTLGLNPQAVFVQGSYLALERTLQGNPALEELALQGQGVSGAPAIRYKGYMGDFANASAVKYVGGGLDNGTNALGTFFADNMMGDTAFAVVWRNGKLYQLNQNGQPGLTLSNAIAAADNTLWYGTYRASDFQK